MAESHPVHSEKALTKTDMKANASHNRVSDTIIFTPCDGTVVTLTPDMLDLKIRKLAERINKDNSCILTSFDIARLANIRRKFHGRMDSRRRRDAKALKVKKMKSDLVIAAEKHKAVMIVIHECAQKHLAPENLAEFMTAAEIALSSPVSATVDEQASVDAQVPLPDI